MSVSRVSLLVLLAGNALLYFGWWAHSEPRSFAQAQVVSRVAEILSDGAWTEEPFVDETDLPDQYLHMRSQGGTRWLSFYAAHYPRQDLGSDHPHDPVLCYEALGWTVSSEVMACEGLTGPEGRQLDASYFRIESAGEERIVVYWEQEAGRMPRVRDAEASWWDALWSRYRGGRSDRIWVRLVGRGHDGVGTVDADRIKALMGAVASAMR